MLDCIVDQVVPLSVDLSILYPVMAEPPLLDGAVQERLIWDEEEAVALRPVGDPGTVALAAGVALASFDGVDSPMEFIAVTL